MNISSFTTNYNQPTFKANPNTLKNPSTFASLATRSTLGVKQVGKAYDSFINGLTKKVIAPMLNSKLIDKLADKTSNVNNMTDHMATAGSFVTTTVYANRTLKKKDLERKPARTLALNQILVTALSTVGAYTINGSIANATKKMSYKFRDANQGHPTLEKRVQGFKIAQKLLTFSLMYRYVAPVLVTPIASKIGKALNSNEKTMVANTPATKQASTTVITPNIAKSVTPFKAFLTINKNNIAKKA